MQKQANISEKIKAIQAIINGTCNFDTLLKPPQDFIAVEYDEYFSVNGNKMQKDEFIEWKKTCRDCDTLLIFTVERALDLVRNASEIEAPKPYRPNVTTEQIEAIEPPLNEPVIDLSDKQETKRKKKEPVTQTDLETTELFAIPVKRSGKLSELGDSWFLSGWN